MTKWVAAALCLLTGVFLAGLTATEDAPATHTDPSFTIVATVLLRSPEPMKLAQFYEALGFKKERVVGDLGVVFHLENHAGSLEVARMDANTQPSGPKTSRTQQGVVAIFETDQQEEVVRRARAAGSPMIEKWTMSTRDVSIYYIADPENNILGFAERHHNTSLNTP